MNHDLLDELDCYEGREAHLRLLLESAECDVQTLKNEVNALKESSFLDIHSLSELKARWLASVTQRINRQYATEKPWSSASEQKRQAALATFLTVNANLLGSEEVHQFKLEAEYQEDFCISDELISMEQADKKSSSEVQVRGSLSESKPAEKAFVCRLTDIDMLFE